ncbi:hypothetical protein U9M48_012564 [Paspalum notatum var. saurae]|uniref:Uncharacterized protein n=1 Tax=Paspalum notatum var. saurae TaxID=547442 RepID=A0AAQ3SYQ9_PASNO
MPQQRTWSAAAKKTGLQASTAAAVATSSAARRPAWRSGNPAPAGTLRASTARRSGGNAKPSSKSASVRPRSTATQAAQSESTPDTTSWKQCSSWRRAADAGKGPALARVDLAMARIRFRRARIWPQEAAAVAMAARVGKRAAAERRGGRRAAAERGGGAWRRRSGDGRAGGDRAGRRSMEEDKGARWEGKNF